VQDLPQLFGQTYGALMQYLSEMGEQPAGMPFAAYYDLDMQDLDVEIGFPVARRLPDRGNIKSGALPAGHYASTMHVGPYDKLMESYTRMERWMKENGHTPAEYMWEFYLNEPGKVPPEQLMTQLIWPIK
jgi:effector-binding domain-containing protein